MLYSVVWTVLINLRLAIHLGRCMILRRRNNKSEVRSQKQEVRSKKKSYLLPLVSACCLLPPVSYAYAETYNNINPVRSQHAEVDKKTTNVASSPVETSNGVKAKIEGDTTIL